MDHELNPGNIRNTDVEMEVNEKQTDQRDRAKISNLHQDDFCQIRILSSSDQDASGVPKQRKYSDDYIRMTFMY